MNKYKMINDDECKTWKYKLLLDERNQVSYPDATETEDGFIYITYDRERAAGSKNMDEVYNCAREILFAKITEEDIIAGKIVNEESRLKCIISKLDEYKGEKYPFTDKPRLQELIPYFAKGDKEETLDKLFTYFYRELSPALTIEEHRLLDELIDELDKTMDKSNLCHKIVKLFYNAARNDKTPVVELTRNYILDNLTNNLSEDKIANQLGLSKYYLHYRFKMLTGITLDEYCKVLRDCECTR